MLIIIINDKYYVSVYSCMNYFKIEYMLRTYDNDNQNITTVGKI